jgi:hypothetical protein
MSYPNPRHLICALGEDLDALIAAAESFRGTAVQFTVDRDYSSDEADDRMDRSFGVCWDRVWPGAWTDADEEAVASHGAVMYALSPSLEREHAAAAAADAVKFAAHLLDHGAVAVKGESAGIAHGAARWRQLANELDLATGRARDRIARLAMTKRPLGGDDYYESLGNHLVGLPEVYIGKAIGLGERAAVHRMDEIADELAGGTSPAGAIDAVITKYSATLDLVSPYEGGFEFKINPYGILRVPTQSPLLPARVGI